MYPLKTESESGVQWSGHHATEQEHHLCSSSSSSSVWRTVGLRWESCWFQSQLMTKQWERELVAGEVTGHCQASYWIPNTEFACPGQLPLLCVFVSMCGKTLTSPVWEIIKVCYSSFSLLGGCRYGHSCSDRTDVPVGFAALLMSHWLVQEAHGQNGLKISHQRSGDKANRNHTLHSSVVLRFCHQYTVLLLKYLRNIYGCIIIHFHAIAGGNDCCGVS